MPGRLEFEHEVDNDAELPVKDMEFGLVFKYGGDEQPQAKVTAIKPADDDEEDEGENGDGEAEDGADVKEEDGEETKPVTTKANGDDEPEKKKRKGKEKAKEEDENSVAGEQLVEIEDEDELEVKLALLDIYFSKLDKREDAKDLIFDRGLTEYKKVRRVADIGMDRWRARLTQRRSRPTSAKRPKTRRSWCIGTRHLPSCRRHWTTRP